MFLNDVSKKTQESRAEKIPDMFNARREGKIAHMIMDKLTIYDRHVSPTLEGHLMMPMLLNTTILSMLMTKFL